MYILSSSIFPFSEWENWFLKKFNEFPKANAQLVEDSQGMESVL